MTQDIAAEDWWHSLERFGMRPGLERTRHLLTALGNPERGFPAVHVAGTNGKGSTAVMIAAALQAAGLRVGLTTSPDLGDVRERVLVNGEKLSAGDWKAWRVAVAVKGHNLPEPPTTFEALTGLAFSVFAEAHVDVGVVEVGLGGRYDATNTLPAPLVTVFTPIARDHEEILGRGLEAIARDKSGIVKRGTLAVVSAWQSPKVRAILLQAARAHEVPIQFVQGRCLWSDASGVTIRGGQNEVVRTGLLGRHQAQNLAVAWATLGHLRQRWALDPEAMRHALQNVRWPGRMEVVRQQPLVVLDAAHNLHGAKALASALAEPHLARPWHLVFGHLEDKPGLAMLRALLPVVKTVTLTRPVSARASDPALLRGKLTRSSHMVHVEADWRRALSTALREVPDGGGVLVAGSLYLVGPARQWLIEEGGDN